MVSQKLAVIGAGSVGSSIAYAAVLKRIASQVIMVDIDFPRCEAQVLDISDCAFMSETKIKVGTFQDAGMADIIVITAGAKQRVGESRVELIDRNYKILESCITSMKPFNPNAVLLLVSNPVDVLTFFAQKLSGLPPHQVIGSGTFLDSARLRSSLSDILGISETAIHANVLGEHGDSQFVAWSAATVGNTPLLSMPELKTIDKEKLAQEVKNKAYKIIEAKGATHYGIGGCAASICESILRNTCQVRPVSHFIPEYGVCLSLPAVIGCKGIIKTMNMPLSTEEKSKLTASAKNLKEIIDKYS